MNREYSTAHIYATATTNDAHIADHRRHIFIFIVHFCELKSERAATIYTWSMSKWILFCRCRIAQMQSVRSRCRAMNSKKQKISGNFSETKNSMVKWIAHHHIILSRFSQTIHRQRQSVCIARRSLIRHFDIVCLFVCYSNVAGM